MRDAIAKAKGFDASKLSKDDAFERDYLVNVAQGKLFWLEDADQPHTNPAWYIGGGLDPNVYVARNYADAPTRMRALIAFYKQVPQAAANIRANLKTPMPLSFMTVATAAFNGFADYYTGDAKAAFASVKDPALQKKFDDAAAPAARAMHDLATWLDGQKATATQGYALGADKFSRMVRQTEGVDVPLDTLEAAGRADLARNQVALKEACAKFDPGATILACTQKMGAHKAEGGPVAAARKMIPELRAFVVKNDLVSIPGTEQARRLAQGQREPAISRGVGAKRAIDAGDEDPRAQAEAGNIVVGLVGLVARPPPWGEDRERAHVAEARGSRLIPRLEDLSELDERVGDVGVLRALGRRVESQRASARHLGLGEARRDAQRDGFLVGGDGEREGIARDGSLRAKHCSF